jgi:hypothetical protein
LKKSSSSGEIYVALEDALEIENMEREGDLRSLAFRDVENHLVRENYLPKWPIPSPLVHPVGDSHGMRRHGLPCFSCTGVDSRQSWILCVMVYDYLICGWL